MWAIRPWFILRRGNSPDKRRESASSESKIYYPSLDGWRALSVVAVILYHGRFTFFSKHSIMERISSHGEIGVDVFFAISGFLISSLLLREFQRNGRISLRGFYLRRFCRIVPAYYLAIAIISILGIMKLIPVNSSDLLSCLFFYRDYKPLGMDFSGGFYTAHFWTLAIEEHFYLLWPLILLLVRPKRIGAVATIIAIAVLSWREIEMHFHVGGALFKGTDLMTRTDTRIDSLLWACVAAIYFPGIKRLFDHTPTSEIWLPIATVVAALLAFHVPGSDVLIPIILPLLVLSTVVKPNSVFGRFLNCAPLRWIGTLSYSIYLWQQLFLPELHSMLGHGVLGELQLEPWNLLSILCCACLSYYLLERPMLRLGYRLSALSQRPIGDSVTMAPALGPLALEIRDGATHRQFRI